MNLPILPITYLCHIKQMDILASPTFQLFCGLLLSWCLMLDLLTNSGPLFVGWPLGLWCSPRYPHCELPRPPISLLSTEETKSAPGNIFFQSIKSRILCGIISYCALMAPSEMLFLACYFQLSKKRLLFCDLSCTSPSTFFSWWGYRSILSLVHNWRLNISSFSSSTSDCWCHCSHMQPWWCGTTITATTTMVMITPW